MSINFSPLFSTFSTQNQAFHTHRRELYEFQRQHGLLEKLNHQLQIALNENEEIDWSHHEENRTLIDEIHDLMLLGEGIEKKYVFSTAEELMTYNDILKTAIQKKAQDVQENNQLSQKKREELMQFYQTLLDCISKISQTIQNTLSRIH